MQKLESADLAKSLEKISLNQKQALIYLALLELGPSPVRAISLLAGLKTPTTYVILDELRQMDAVLFHPNSKKKLYSAKNPEALFSEAKARLRSALRDLPALMALGRKSQPETLVTYFEGAEGYEQAMRYKEDEIPDDSELLSYFASAENVNPLTLPFVDRYLKSLKDKNVSIRAFAPNHPTLEGYRSKDKAFYHNVKVLPTEIYSAASSIEISEKLVKFTLFKEDMYVVIDNAEIAKVMREIFEMNWSKY